VRRWFSEKGFGFIEPDDGSNDIFLHIRHFTTPSGEPKVGDRIEYEVGTDPANGKLRAQHVRLI
jgi:cold shock CspA family protein